MSSHVEWNGDAVVLQLKSATGRGLIAAALFVQSQHKRLLNVSNPRPYLTPSQPGEYPRKRTGQLQAAVLFSPQSAQQAAQTLRVALGYADSVPYGLILEREQQRLGLLETVKRFAPQIMALAGGSK